MKQKKFRKTLEKDNNLDCITTTNKNDFNNKILELDSLSVESILRIKKSKHKNKAQFKHPPNENNSQLENSTHKNNTQFESIINALEQRDAMISQLDTKISQLDEKVLQLEEYIDNLKEFIHIFKVKEQLKCVNLSVGKAKISIRANGGIKAYSKNILMEAEEKMELKANELYLN